MLLKVLFEYILYYPYFPFLSIQLTKQERKRSPWQYYPQSCTTAFSFPGLYLHREGKKGDLFKTMSLAQHTTQGGTKNTILIITVSTPNHICKPLSAFHTYQSCLPMTKLLVFLLSFPDSANHCLFKQYYHSLKALWNLRISFSYQPDTIQNHLGRIV